MFHAKYLKLANKYKRFAVMHMIVSGTINGRLSPLHQGGGPVPAPSPVFAPVVPAVAAAPGTAQGHVDTDVERPVA